MVFTETLRQRGKIYPNLLGLRYFMKFLTVPTWWQVELNEVFRMECWNYHKARTPHKLLINVMSIEVFWPFVEKRRYYSSSLLISLIQ